MKSVYKIIGMTCQGCADSIQNAISSKSFAISAHVDLQSAQLTLESNSVIDLKELNSAINDLGIYKILNNKPILLSRLTLYLIAKKPILIALTVVVLSSLSIQLSNENFSLNNWFISYMGIFFLIFSFFKLLNVKGFSNTFSKYDPIAKLVPGFGLIYPFIELILGLAFLSKSFLLTANILTLFLMISQSFGVTKSLIGKDTFQCACMGSSIDLQLSSLTLIEDLIMILMSAYMIISLVQNM